MTESNYKTICGVPGEMNAPAVNASGTIMRQVWRSETRRINGREKIRAEIRFDDSCKNGHESFAITGEIIERGRVESCGCIHDDIAKHFPELAHLIGWHLTSTDGPMHYVANTAHHASNRDFDAARRCAKWPEATDEQLSLPSADLESILKARLPSMLADFKAAMIEAGLTYPARNPHA